MLFVFSYFHVWGSTAPKIFPNPRPLSERICINHRKSDQFFPQSDCHPKNDEADAPYNNSPDPLPVISFKKQTVYIYHNFLIY